MDTAVEGFAMKRRPEAQAAYAIETGRILPHAGGIGWSWLTKGSFVKRKINPGQMGRMGVPKSTRLTHH
jgi:hypothetical protein